MKLNFWLSYIHQSWYTIYNEKSGNKINCGFNEKTYLSADEVIFIWYLFDVYVFINLYINLSSIYWIIHAVGSLILGCIQSELYGLRVIKFPSDHFKQEWDSKKPGNWCWF